MPKLWLDLSNRLPLQFRVLYRQFLLRIVDLEALSIQADIPRFLGQFAGVLIMFNLLHSLVAWEYMGFSYRTPAEEVQFGLHFEHYLIATMMLVTGLISVLTWDSVFPDRRDALVLSPLPVPSHTVLFARMAASGAILGLAIVALNGTVGLTWPFALWAVNGGSFLRIFAAYWFTIVAASVFLYGSVLGLQGLLALVLPRRVFLRLSALLQIAAFCVFLGGYFLQPSLSTPAALAAPGNQPVLAASPSYWFFALFGQLSGTAQPGLAWAARRAWIALAIAVAGGSISLLLCYLRTMQKTVEEPDLVPASGSSRFAPRLGNSLQTALLLFTLRSLTRSRHHRMAYSVYLAIVFAIGLAFVRDTLSIPAPRAINLDFLMSTIVMSGFTIIGLRKVFSLPVSLTANWVLRITQLRPSQDYIAATRRSLLLLAALPVWLVSALMSLFYRPWQPAAAHLVILALLCFIFADLSLIGFSKAPFTCSYLPGKANLQFVFWASVLLLLPAAVFGAKAELRALQSTAQTACLAAGLAALSIGLWAFNRRRAKSAILLFEEELPEEVTTLGIGSFHPSMSTTDQ
jgi:hypothetical protein